MSPPGTRSTYFPPSGKLICAISTFLESNPGFTSCSRNTLSIISPAPTSNTIANAISQRSRATAVPQTVRLSDISSFSFTQRSIRVGSRRLPRRNQSKQNRRQYRNAQRKNQYAPLKSNWLRKHEISCHSPENRDADKREQDPRYATKSRQHAALDQHLLQ